MKVTEMIKVLQEFNPNAEVEINIDSITHPLVFDGWVNESDGDSEKSNAKSVIFVHKINKENKK